MLFDKLAEIYFEIIVKSFIEINVHMAKIVFVGKKSANLFSLQFAKFAYLVDCKEMVNNK